MMDIFEREEREYEMNARYDYLSEAFGAEARLLAAQAEDERVADNGFFSRTGMQEESRRWTAKNRAAQAIARNHAGPEEDVPF